MKLSDPFGRMAKKHQAGYEAMSEAMRRAGIDTPRAAREIIKKSEQRAVKILLVGVPLLSLIGLLWKQVMPLAFGLGVFLAVWTITSMINGKRYIRRYIDEELK